MNVFIVRAFAFLMGVILLLSLIIVSPLRQNPSSAYWLVDNGTDTDDFPLGVYRMLPNGDDRIPILTRNAPRTNSSQMYWVEGRAQFLYAECTDGELIIKRAAVTSHQTVSISTDLPIGEQCPWEVIPSPDRKKLLFRIFDGGTHALIITEFDGSNPIVLTETFNSISGSETWSPDSRFVYFGAFSDSGGGIHRVSADGKQFDRVAIIRFLDSPMWSSDGNRLTFITNGFLHQIDVSTDQVRQLSDSSEAQYQRAAWVNDEWMVTVGADNSRRSFYRLETETAEQSLLIPGILDSRYTLTTDGIAVVLAGETNAQALFGVDVETRQRWSISPTGFWFSDLVLSSDEEWVYFASTFEGTNRVYRAKVDGSDIRHLYQLEDDDRNVDLQLSPDDRWLIVSLEVDDFPNQHKQRVRINLQDGHVERLPEGGRVFASPLLDLAMGGGRLVLIGIVLILLPIVIPLSVVQVRRLGQR